MTSILLYNVAGCLICRYQLDMVLVFLHHFKMTLVFEALTFFWRQYYSLLSYIGLPIKVNRDDWIDMVVISVWACLAVNSHCLGQFTLMWPSCSARRLMGFFCRPRQWLLWSCGDCSGVDGSAESWGRWRLLDWFGASVPLAMSGLNRITQTVPHLPTSQISLSRFV